MSDVIIMSDMSDDRITVRGIPKEIWLRAAVTAKLSGKTIGQFVAEAIREKLAKSARK
jgi:hypothetical protein